MKKSLYDSLKVVNCVRNQENIVVVGNGIAAKCVVYFLNKQGFNNITLIADDNKAPSCSLRTTSTNCLRGTEKGVSDLGDLIIKSYDDFVRFFQLNNPIGISKSIEVHTTPINSTKLDKWERRYKKYDKKSKFDYFSKSLNQEFFSVDNEAYFIFPEIFFKWIDEKLDFIFVNDTVSEIKNSVVVTDSGAEIGFDKLILCTSYMTDNFLSVVDENIKSKLEKAKPVPGTYLSYPISLFDPIELKLDEDYCFRIDDIHLLVRPTAGDVLIGSSSKSNILDFTHDEQAIKSMHNRLKSYLKNVVTLPSFEKAQLITGIRHKGQARRPFWGEVNKDIFAVWGLYKNAFTFAFTAGEEIANLIKKSD